MKRTISSSVLNKKSPSDKDKPVSEEAIEQIGDVDDEPELIPTSGLKPRIGGSGSAWKAGAQVETQTLLDEKRAQLSKNILQGQHEVLLDPSQVSDEIGSDRRDDWRDQKAFVTLKNSIEKNGQDTPIQVWPVDPNWKPDSLEPENVGDVPFLLIVGRRRHAILTELRRPIRAILANPEKRGVSDDLFEMLFMRFRENEERENLGAFERLVSVGQMYEQYTFSKPGKRVTAVDFAKQIDVHESHVSRGKAVYAARDKILHACKNPYDLSYRDLEKLLTGLGTGSKPKSLKQVKSNKLTTTRSVGGNKFLISSQNGKVLISSTGLNLGKHNLEGLSDVIAAYLEKNKPNE